MGLVGVIAISLVARVFAASARSVPRYFPDEYIYASLARSLSEGRLTIRGVSPHFPAMLEPVLAAPFWLLADQEGAYALTQGLHALAMSLAAAPVFWLAGRLGLPVWQKLCCAAFAVAIPSLLYSGFVMAEAIAYPLVLGAIAAGVAALDRPTRRNQFAFVALTLFATLARLQYVVIALAFVTAAVVLTGGRPLQLLRRYRSTWLLLGIPAGLVLTVGLTQALGYYQGVLDFSLSPVSIGRWIAIDAMLLSYSAWGLVPGAIVGCWLSFRQPLAPIQRAFAVLATVFAVLLLLEAGLYASNGSPRFQERYLFTLLPLVPIAFCLGLRHLGGARRVTALIALGMLLVTARFPLSSYTGLDGTQDSPFLMSVSRFEQTMPPGTALLLLAAVAGGLSLLAAVAAYRPRLAGIVLLVSAVVAALAASVGATVFDLEKSNRMRRTFADAQGRMDWIDRTGMGDTAVLVPQGAHRPAVSSHLFWNRSLTSILRLPGAPAVDNFGDRVATISRTGDLLVEGRPVTTPLLVEEYNAVAIVDDAQLVARTSGASLWRPRTSARLTALVTGLYFDGWIGRQGSIVVWPRKTGPRTGAVSFRLALPPVQADRATLVVRAPGFERQITLRPGTAAGVRVPFRAISGPVRIRIDAATALVSGSRTFAATMSAPRIVESTVPERSDAAGGPAARSRIDTAPSLPLGDRARCEVLIRSRKGAAGSCR